MIWLVNKCRDSELKKEDIKIDEGIREQSHSYETYFIGIVVADIMCTNSLIQY